MSIINLIITFITIYIITLIITRNASKSIAYTLLIYTIIIIIYQLYIHITTKYNPILEVAALGITLIITTFIIKYLKITQK